MLIRASAGATTLTSASSAKRIVGRLAAWQADAPCTLSWVRGSVSIQWAAVAAASLPRLFVWPDGWSLQVTAGIGSQAQVMISEVVPHG